MGDDRLKGRRVAILVTRGFEQEELTEPRRVLDEHGADTDIVSPVEASVRAWNHTDWGDEFPVDVRLENADGGRYDALLLPGGVMNPDKLRIDERAVAFVRHFVDAGKPIAAICHAPWMLIEAGGAQGRKLTSYPSLRTDLVNAGATWGDQEVVTDRGVVTSRKPDDLPAFNRAMVEVFAAPARHRGAA